MNFGLDILHIGGFINNNITIIIIAAVLAVISAIGCAVITATRRGFMDDIILSAVFGLIFNVLGLLFVFFRKPVWLVADRPHIANDNGEHMFRYLQTTEAAKKNNIYFWKLLNANKLHLHYHRHNGSDG